MSGLIDDSDRAGISRRGALSAAAKALGAAGAIVSAPSLGAGLWGLAIAPVGQSPIRPPGAVSEPDFLARCIHCFLCGEVCPPGCIVFPAAIESPDTQLDRPPTGFVREEPDPPAWRRPGTPWILPWKRGCTLCMACTEICPTGALAPVPRPPEGELSQVRMGKAILDEKICLPWNRVSWCGACYTACPLKERAIRVDHQNRPTVLEGCVGCGLCVEMCPIKYKAIAVLPRFAPDVGEVRPE